MTTKSLFNILEKANIKHNLQEDIQIDNLTDDSRKVSQNSLFLAPNLEISKTENFIKMAVQKGAKIVIAPKNNYSDFGVPIIQVEDDKIAKMHVAKAMYPKQPENVYAVTGSNGKTSTAHFIRQMLYFTGIKAISIGTLGVGYDENNYDLSKENASLTTPGAIDLHRILDSLADNYNYAALEASSHGLDQHRLDMVKVKAVGFTNFTQDHLDYHKTMGEYFAAKMRIFDLVQKGSIAAVNSDIAQFNEIVAKTSQKQLQLIDFGYKAKAIKIISCIPNIKGMAVELEYFGKKMSFELSLVGDFQLYNFITALAMLANDINNPEDIIPKLSPVPGRMQKVNSSKNIYVDYAHTPDALEKALKVIKDHKPNKIITVFGCGGERDALKRPIMGDIAAKLSDAVIVTDDNPRSEDAASIRKQVIGSHKFIEIADRKLAIQEAVSMAGVNDIVLIAGKGHEKYQIIGDTKLDFDDVKIAEEI
ncbi:MAG: hypothetical protein BGO27_06510 [Alphaproteobacteria bacterium 33-17]|nr:MAG: hypothetical protein BGO27_06510 [Alphaproteobacteria bacterium 33-17]